MQKLPFPAPFVFRPQRQSACGQFGVRLAGAVGAAHDAGFAARRCARVAGPQASSRVTRAPRFKKMKGGPAAEGAGTDDSDVGLDFILNDLPNVEVEDTRGPQ